MRYDAETIEAFKQLNKIYRELQSISKSLFKKYDLEKVSDINKIKTTLQNMIKLIDPDGTIRTERDYHAVMFTCSIYTRDHLIFIKEQDKNLKYTIDLFIENLLDDYWYFVLKKYNDGYGYLSDVLDTEKFD